MEGAAKKEYRVRKRKQDECIDLRQSMEDAEILTDVMVRRFLARAGWRQSSPAMVGETREFVCAFLRKIIHTMTVYMQHNNSASVKVDDVVRACRYHGLVIYGFDDVCVIPDPQGHQWDTYHVTEMVEMPTVFSNPSDWNVDEPDMEPNERYKKTDFVANYTENAMEDEDDYCSDDQSWTWYGDSDDDADVSDTDSTTSYEEKIASRPQWLRRQEPTPREQFLASLEAAQTVVDEELCDDSSLSGNSDCDQAMGQAHESDFDDEKEPECMDEWIDRAEWEESQWEPEGDPDHFHVDEGSAASMIEAHMEGTASYVLPRQVFRKLFYHIFQLTVRVSSAALSALHNTTEQYFYRSLIDGPLRTRLSELLLARSVEEQEELRTQLALEHEKVKKQQIKMEAERDVFKSKEQEMQRQIAELKRKLIHYQSEHDPANPATPSKSPGKRKAKSVGDLHSQAPAKTSIVGALKSRIYDLRSNKKVRINPM